MMVDIAERKSVNNINLTSQAPVITVQGQNTGNTEADRQSLADLLGDLVYGARAEWQCRCGQLRRMYAEPLPHLFFTGQHRAVPAHQPGKASGDRKNPTMASIMCLALALSCSRARQSCVR